MLSIAFNVHFTDGRQILYQMLYMHKTFSFLFNQFISDSESLLCQAGGNAHVRAPLLTWCIEAVICLLPTPSPLRCPLFQATLSLGSYDCAAFMSHLALGLCGEAGNPMAIPFAAPCSSPVCAHLPTSVRTLSGSRRDSQMSLTF